jgi:hypothetical protein
MKRLMLFVGVVLLTGCFIARAADNQAVTITRATYGARENPVATQNPVAASICKTSSGADKPSRRLMCV